MSADTTAAVPAVGTSRRTWVWRIASLAISLAALAVVAASVDLLAAWTVVTDASVPIVMAALGVVAIQVVVRGWRWRIVLPERPDGTAVPVRRTIAPLLVGYLGNAVLPARLGEPVRAALIARREALDPFAAFGATMLERLIDIVTLALIGLAAAVVLGASWWIVTIAFVASVGGIAVLAILVVLGMSRFTDLLASLMVRAGLAERTRRLQRWAQAFAGGVDRGRDVPRLAKAVALSLVAWILDAGVFWLVGRALGLDLGIAEAVLIGAVAVLATAIPAAPGYVGTFELAATTTAAALGVPRPEALALALLVHVITVVPLALAGGLALASSGLRLGRLAAQAERVEHGAA